MRTIRTREPGKRFPAKPYGIIKRRPAPGTALRLLTAWCLSADLLLLSVRPFDSLSAAAAVRFPTAALIFCLQLVFLRLLALLLKDRWPHPERALLPAAFAAYSFATLWQKRDWFYWLPLVCLWAVLLRYYNGRGWLRLKKPLTKKKSAALIAAAAVVFFLVAGGAGTLRYLCFRCPNYDFGIFSQMFYSMKTTFCPLTTCERDRLLSHFAVHLSPILYALLPVYAAFPSPITLQLSQAAVLGSAVAPLALLCRLRGLSHTRTAAFALVLLCFPAVACGTNYDFHENCFLLPLLLWLFYAYEARRPILLAAFTVGVLSVKEDAAVYVAFFALFVFLDGKRRLQGGLLFAAACAYFLLAVRLLSVRGEGIMAGRYGNFIADGGTLLQAVKNVLADPGYALLQTLRDADGDALPKLTFFLQTAAPLAFLPFAVKSPTRLLLLLPSVLLHFLTLYRYQFDVGFQYGFGTAAFLLYGSVLNAAGVKPETGRLLLSVAAAAGALAFFAFPFARFTDYAAEYRENAAAYRATAAALREIPADADVACTTMLLPHLSRRDTVYETYYHAPAAGEKLDYVILDARYDVDETLEAYLARGYRVAKTAEYGGETLLYILR